MIIQLYTNARVRVRNYEVSRFITLYMRKSDDFLFLVERMRMSYVYYNY